MKNLLLLIALGVLGYFGYHEWAARPARLKAEQVQVAPTPEQTDPWLRMKVRRLYDEWRRRNAGTEKKQPVFRTDMSEILSEIKMQGPHTKMMLEADFARALIELGVDPREAGVVARDILEEADRDGRKGGHDRSAGGSGGSGSTAD